jgi:hypothetical protein
VSQVKQDNLHKVHKVERKDVLKRALLAAPSVLCLEVEGGKGEDSGCITGMGQGAKKMFGHAPWGDVHGHSLAHFVKCEDLPAFHHTVEVARKTAKTGRTYPASNTHLGAPPIHFMHYHSPQGPNQTQRCESDCFDDRLPSAFCHDPLLDVPPCDQTDAEKGFNVPDVTELPALMCEYVPCEMSVHVVPSASAATSCASSSAGSDKGTPEPVCLEPLEAPQPPQGQEGGHWKAVILAPLDMARASTGGCRVCCGGGCDCRRSALLSLLPS